MAGIRLDAIQKHLFESYTRSEAYKYLRNKDFKRQAGITKRGRTF